MWDNSSFGGEGKRWETKRRKWRENTRLMMSVSLVPQGVLSLETCLGVDYQKVQQESTIYSLSLLQLFLRSRERQTTERKWSFYSPPWCLWHHKHNQDKLWSVFKQIDSSLLYCTHPWAKRDIPIKVYFSWYDCVPRGLFCQYSSVADCAASLSWST